jgi:hypothetical protein
MSFDARSDASTGDGIDGTRTLIDASTCSVDPFDTLSYTSMGAGACSSSNAQLLCTIPGPMGAYALIQTSPVR